jgi:hypothetical protein
MKTVNIGNHRISYDVHEFNYNSSVIKWNEVIDYQFEHSYLNGTGGLDFYIYSKTISVHISEFVAFYRSKNKASKIDQLLDVINEILPIITVYYARHCLREIKAKGYYKIGRFYFKHKTIEYRPGFMSLSHNVELPYENAKVIIDNVRLGLFGGKGSAPKITLVDYKNFIEYNCGSINQLSQSTILKVQTLLNLFRDHEIQIIN